nr:Holliday junction resolvase RuvX [uncultured Celeribacter sp.]
MSVITDDISEFRGIVPPMSPLAGLDFGDKTIGVAISDRLWSVATPIDTIRRKKFTTDAEALLALLKSREVRGIVLGLPRNMDGSEGPRCQKTRAFARNLGQLTDLPITFWDERLSSVAADRAMLEADMSRAKRAAKIDQVAAGVILQGALDRMGHL